MARFGMIGPSYASQSLNADCQITKNFYVEQIEQPNGKAAYVLYPTPGTILFAALPGQPVRGQLEINGRSFAVSGTNFCEVKTDGTFTVIAQVLNDLLPVSMAASPQQLLLVSAGALYVYWLQTTIGGTNPQSAGTFTRIAAAQFTIPSSGAVGQVSQVEFIDGFFILLLKNSQAMYISAAFDASTWLVNGTAQIIVVSVFSDNVQSIIENQRRLYVQGRKRSTVYYDSGSANIFDVDPSGTSESGSVAIFGVARADNTIFWIDQDERGSAIVRKNSGYTPVRISNHAIEFALNGYRKSSTISDCVTYSYQDQGHTFIVFNFPTAQATWVYDVATAMWHERGFWNAQTGLYSAHKSGNHAFAFGKHLVGDPTSGNIYQMEIAAPAMGGGWNFATDAGGALIRRLRRSPHVSIENKWQFYSELIIDAETGLGPQPPLMDGSGNQRGPKIALRWSKDYAHTWSNEYDLDAGMAGDFRHRLRRAKLGRARDLVIELSTTDPVPWRLIEGYLYTEGGEQPRKAQERLAHTFGRIT